MSMILQVKGHQGFDTAIWLQGVLGLSCLLGVPQSEAYPKQLQTTNNSLIELICTCEIMVSSFKRWQNKQKL